MSRFRSGQIYFFQLGSDSNSGWMGINGTIIVGGTVPLNSWSHVAGTWDTSTILRLYVNGTLVNMGSYGVLFFPSDVEFVIGASLRKNGPQIQFQGDIEDARVYSRTLTDNEILTISSLDGSDNIVAGLVARYMLNERPPDTTVVTGDVKDIGPDGLHITDTIAAPTYTDGRARSARRLVEPT